MFLDVIETSAVLLIGSCGRYLARYITWSR